MSLKTIHKTGRISLRQRLVTFLNFDRRNVAYVCSISQFIVFYASFASKIYLMSQKAKEFELIQDVLNGKRNAYRELVDRHSALVFSIVNRFAKSDTEAKELAQQIFVKTYERLSSFKGNSKFSSWLYMIAMNHCRDYAKDVRRNNSRFSEMDGYELDNKLQDNYLPDEELENKEWADLLERGLDYINEDYAKAFLMKYNDNMSYKAMAKRLDVKVGALKVRVYRAKKELKEFIEKNNINNYG